MKSKLDTILWDFMQDLDEFWQDYLLSQFHQRKLRPDMTLKEALSSMDSEDDYHISIFEQFLSQISAPRELLGEPLVIKLDSEPINTNGKNWRDVSAYQEEKKTKSYDDIGLPLNELKRFCSDDELNELEYIIAKLFCGWFTDVGAIQRKLWTLINGESMINSPDPHASARARENSIAHSTKSLDLVNSILSRLKKSS